MSDHSAKTKPALEETDAPSDEWSVFASWPDSRWNFSGSSVASRPTLRLPATYSPSSSGVQGPRSPSFAFAENVFVALHRRPDPDVCSDLGFGLIMHMVHGISRSEPLVLPSRLYLGKSMSLGPGHALRLISSSSSRFQILVRRCQLSRAFNVYVASRLCGGSSRTYLISLPSWNTARLETLNAINRMRVQVEPSPISRLIPPSQPHSAT